MRGDLADNTTLVSLERKLSTPRGVSLERLRCLGIGIYPSTEKNEPQSETSKGREGGLPSLLVSLLTDSFESWRTSCQRLKEGLSKSDSGVDDDLNITKFQNHGNFSDNERSPQNRNFRHSREMTNLRRVINLISNATDMDPTLGEEVGRAGIQSILSNSLEEISKCISFVESNGSCEEDLDALMEFQDTVFQIYSPRARSMAFTNDELHNRLPLVYNLTAVARSNIHTPIKLKSDDNTTILINQVYKRQSAQADVGFVMWPSAIVLSRWLITNPEMLHGKSALELGAGCGLTGIVAASLMAKHHEENNSIQVKPDIEQNESPSVIITDVNNLVLENIKQNIKLNDLSLFASVAKLDFYRQTGFNFSPGGWISGDKVESAMGTSTSKNTHDPVDVILAADIICQPEDATAVAKTIHDSLIPPSSGRGHGVAFVVCANSEHRFGVEYFAGECSRIGLEVTSTDVKDMYGGDLLSECMDSASGYVEGMNLTFFKIIKQ